MPRKPRIEYAGAVYHVMDRGDRLETIFRDAGDRELFLKTLGQACERPGWRVHSYVLMGNHYHLLLETPEPNLSVGMQWLQSTYTIRHNVKHRLRGHLFQGRYKAVPVDGEDGTYFRTVSDYIHLNPARAGLVSDRLLDYRWSSFPALVGAPRKRPRWLCAQWVLEQGDRASGRMALTAIALALGETEMGQARPIREAVSCDGIVDAAIQFIWTNCHRALGVNDIAKHVGISRRMLERRFARTWSRSVAHELSMARVHRGRELLSEKTLTVKEAGYAAGFGGSRRFISAHRRLFGTTPGLARRRRCDAP